MRSVLFAVALALAGPAAAQRSTFCCNDESGRQVCGDILPTQCYGRAYRELNERGVTVRRVEAPLTPEQRAQKEAEARRQREAERQLVQARKRDQALLDAYSSEQDIESQRDRTLAEIETSIRRAQQLHGEVLKRQQALAAEMEFYAKKTPPKELVDALREAESELRAHLAVIEAKRKEMDAVRAKYDAERQRYVELTRGGAAERTR